MCTCLKFQVLMEGIVFIVFCYIHLDDDNFDINGTNGVVTVSKEVDREVLTENPIRLTVFVSFTYVEDFLPFHYTLHLLPEMG